MGMRMKSALCVLCSVLFCAAGAGAASSEGTPVYYQNYGVGNQNVYVGNQRQVQVIGQKAYEYQVPRQLLPAEIGGAMTPNGVATDKLAPWILSAEYTRRFADFEFKTGVNSVLEWDDMVFNEIGVRFDSNFTVKNYDLFAFGEYRMGRMSHGGLSMDYDLEPYDHAQKDLGIFTISVGDQSGKTSYMRFGFGAKQIWNLSGWKLSPSIGYEIFKHDLEMSNHYYPNPGVYLPLLTPNGEYVFGDDKGYYYNYAQDRRDEAVEAGLYQVCLSPEDIMLGYANPDGSLETNQNYDPTSLNPYIPWGVGPGQCVIIGGDGPILVTGTTHIYNTTWSGVYLGLEVEKQMTYNDKLRFYLQVGMPNYSSDGIWPNRTDWQQHPSFVDKGSKGSYSYQAELEYNYKLSDRLTLSLKVDTNFFHVGDIGGELYVASYSDYAIDANGQYIFQASDGSTCDPNIDTSCFPLLQTVEAHTEDIQDSLKYANWQSFGLHLGAKYSF
jgi:hypothetical protein